MKIIKIVITGGVCSGKTSCLPIIEKHLKNSKYGLIFVPETASEIISQGFDVRKTSMFNFQEAVLLNQLKNEQLYLEKAELMKNDTVLMFLDRGAADAFGYLNESDASKLISKYNLTEEELLNRYDAVIHLVTAADGAEEFYTLANNSARTESPEEARILDKRIQKAWANHKRRYIIRNDGGFDFKMQQMLDVIDSIVS